jgi:predicted methyltransferase
MTIFQANKGKVLAAIGLLLLSQLGTAQTAIPDYVKKALGSSERTSAMTERDPGRHPGEVLAMSGIKPGSTVVEIAGFGQYYTTLLSDIVGPKGKIHVFDLPYMEKSAGVPSRAFAAAHPNIVYTIVNYNEIKLPTDVDVVFNILYYHDLMINDIDAIKMNKAIFAALKPGGVYLIEDHNAAPGSGTTDTKKLHRIDPEVIKKEVLAAGFVLAEDSKLQASKDDDHTKMVFAPGARGATDRSLFKFVKPAK